MPVGESKATDTAERLLAHTVTSVTADTLADPSDLLDLRDRAELVDDETGLPDPDLIERATAQLLARRLAKARTLSAHRGG